MVKFRLNMFKEVYLDWQTNKQTDKQTNKQIKKQTDRQTDIIELQKKNNNLLVCFALGLNFLLVYWFGFESTKLRSIFLLERFNWSKYDCSKLIKNICTTCILISGNLISCILIICIFSCYILISSILIIWILINFNLISCNLFSCIFSSYILISLILIIWILISWSCDQLDLDQLQFDQSYFDQLTRSLHFFWQNVLSNWHRQFVRSKTICLSTSVNNEMDFRDRPR